MDTDQVRSAFEAWGVVRLDGAFPPDDAARMRDTIWRHVERRLGIAVGDPLVWPTDWLPISWKSLKRNPVFRPLMENAAVTGALDVIFGTDGWAPPKAGAQVHFDLPKVGPWSLPTAWHVDGGFEQPTWPVPAVKLFAFCGDVGPEGGGTMVLSGSHRLVDRYRETFDDPPGSGKDSWRRFLRRHPPLDELLRAADRPDRGRSLVGERLMVDDVPVEVTELTGRPGDVVITHLHVFHTASTNATEQPRIMLGKAVFPAGPRPTETESPLLDHRPVAALS